MSLIKPVSVAALLISLGLMSVFAPLYADSAETKVSSRPGGNITTQEEEVLSSSAEKVLRHIAQARSRLHQKDAETAQKELNQADRLLKIMRHILLTARINNRKGEAKGYPRSEDTLPDLIPVYHSLDDLIDIMEAGKNLKAGDRTKAARTQDESDTALQYTEVDLPLAGTQRLLTQVGLDLDKKKRDDADRLLMSIENSLVFVSVGIKQPLFAAKAALYQGMMEWQAGHRDRLKTELQNAIGFFKAAGQSSDAKTRAAADELLPEVKQLLNELHKGGIVSSRFYRLLEQAQAYSERAAEYLNSGWKHYRSKEPPFRSDLIEARFHLVKARIDLFVSHESRRAQQELNIANDFLDHALRVSGKPIANNRYKQQLNKLRVIVKALGRVPSSKELAWYTALQQQLDEMIRTL